MALISLAAGFTAPKRRPKSYKARDAAYSVGGNNGYYIASLPRPYPKNAPQRIISTLAELCKISKGIKKSELQTQMKGCVTKKNFESVKTSGKLAKPD